MPQLSLYQERELLLRLANNDKDAFAEIYHHYWQLLLGMAFNRLKNLQAAEDIVHDVFISIWNNRHKQEIQSLKSYLATAVKYKILKEVRKAALHHIYQQKENAEPFSVISETALDNRRILEILHKEINTLPEKCRLIFRYSREQGMSVKQIACEMDISPKTVENQLNKALKRLRVTIKKHATFLFSFLM